MKAIQYRLVLMLLTAVLARAACDCTHYPWRPSSCYDECSRKVLMRASRPQLTSVVGLSDATADDVIAGRSQDFANLTDAERSEIRDRLQHLSTESVEQLKAILRD